MNLPTSAPPLSPWLEQAWLQRYLDRELKADEQAWFEAYLLDKPHLLDAIDADNALRAVVLAAADPQVQPSLDQADRGEATRAETATVATIEPHRQARRGRLPLLAMAASFVGGLGLASLLIPGPAAPIIDEPEAEAPARLVFDLLRGGRVELREDQGDPRARLMVVDIALPLGSRIAGAHAELGERRVELPAARISGEGFATYTLPRSWRGRAQLHFDLQREGGDALPPVQVEL